MIFKKIFIFIKIFDIFGINSFFRQLNRKKCIILWYHGICEDSDNDLEDYDERHIQKSIFRQQLRFLKQKGYIFMTMSELIDTYKNKRKLGKIVVLTFDDGFRNIITHAYPIMKEFNAKGCVYLVSGLVGSGKLLWTDYIETMIKNSKKGKFEFIFKGEKLVYLMNDKKSYQNTMRDVKNKLKTLSNKERLNHLKQFNNIKTTNFPKKFMIADWKEIQSLDMKILEVGSHTKNHPNLSTLSSSEEFEEELKNSKDEIEKMVGYDINHFCYPAGKYNEDIIRYLNEYGYKSAVTITRDFNNKNTNLYQLKRIEASENFLEFKFLISGTCIFLSKCKYIFFRKKNVNY
ncbi:Polysaccharide deacetylase [uncultured archaeon]|nr:Polysaccharide deacetylase [uncultured archaeon]